MIELTVASRISHAETKTLHLFDEVSIHDTPLPDIMDISINAALLVLWSGMYLVHLFENFSVRLLRFAVRDVTEIFFLTEIEKPDGALSRGILRIKNQKTACPRSV
jgi:hypothetical protein